MDTDTETPFFTETSFFTETPAETTTSTTVTTIETTSQTSHVITTPMTSTATDDGNSDTNLILPIGIVVGAFLIGIITAVVGIYIYRRHFHAKLRRQSTMPLTNEDLGRSKSGKDGIQGPYSDVNVEKLDDMYVEIKGQESQKPTSSQSNKQSPKSPKSHRSEAAPAPETLPRPTLTTPNQSQISFNAQTNIQIDSHSITVDNSQDDYYLDLLPDERQSDVFEQVEQDDLYEDVSVANLSSKDYRSSKGYVNTPEKPPLAKKPAKPDLNQADSISGTSSSRIKPNIPKKPAIQKLFKETSDLRQRHTSSDSSQGSTGQENEEFYENMNTNQTKGKTSVARTSDNIVMYVNCVVNGIPEKHLQSTEL